MKIVVVAPAVNTGAERGFYNRQDVGLGRALAELGHQVAILNAVTKENPARSESLGQDCILIDVPTRSIGSHGLITLRELDGLSPDAVVLFADLQLCAPGIGRWCRRRSIPLVEIVGTLETNRKGRAILARWTRWRNLREFKKATMAAKTPAVEDTLRQNGVIASIVPVGLDATDLRPPSASLRAEAKSLLGVDFETPVLGFVGNLAPYKRPQALIPLLAELRQLHPWKLFMVGDGPLSSDVERELSNAGLSSFVTREPKLTNRDMWRIYGAADVLVNLNENEIFGMAIIESMFYGTPVVAIESPGPKLIIRDKEDGRLCTRDPQELAIAIDETYQDRLRMGESAMIRVNTSFTWESSAKALLQLLGDPK